MSFPEIVSPEFGRASYKTDEPDFFEHVRLTRTKRLGVQESVVE